MCIDVQAVDKVKNISQNEFGLRYSSRMKPVVVVDGTRDWSPIKTFNFDFFKSLYQNNYSDSSKDECQFFPYKTEFKSLKEALNMSSERSRLQPGSEGWYIGWSNCNDNAGRTLRNFYKKPYFFPDTSENIALSWIFMGGPGFGAHMHVNFITQIKCAFFSVFILRWTMCNILLGKLNWVAEKSGGLFHRLNATTNAKKLKPSLTQEK